MRLTFETISDLHSPYLWRVWRRITSRYYVDRGSGCWIWVGLKDRDGYADYSWLGKRWRAHRLLYLIYEGSIPDGLELHHVCGDRVCVNPGHLEPVTHAEHVIRTSDRFRGYRQRDGRYQARITVGGRTVGIGMFDTPEEARAAYEDAVAARARLEMCTSLRGWGVVLGEHSRVRMYGFPKYR